MIAALGNERIVINSRCRLQWEDAQNCNVLLYPEGLVRLSQSAHEILSRCRQPIAADELIADLQVSFPDGETVAEDTREFLEHALEQGWVRYAGE